MMRLGVITCCYFMVNYLFSSPAFAVQSIKIQPDSNENQLDYAIVDVNGDRRVVKNGGKLVVIRGDRLIIVDAFDTKGASVRSVNFVGYAPMAATVKGEDRGYAINTGKDLLKKWSTGGEGNEYRVVAKSGRDEIGKVVIEIVEPEVSYALLSINGHEKVAKPGKFLYLKASDKLKVDRIVTNVDNDLSDVNVQMIQIPVETADLDANYKLFELRFYREELMIARIPLQIEN